MALTAGIRLGPYEILTALGAGGMGEVYKARDTRLAREVAVKVLPTDLTGSPQARERFQREARAIAALSHPNICTVHDVGETDDGQVFLVMELLQGETLQQRLTRAPLDVATVVDLGIALTTALDVAHGAGIIHRDIKPANIFLTAHGPKILDFGLAKAAPQRDASTLSTMSQGPFLTSPGSAVGTVAYMSPEQLRGEDLDARTDLFSFGLVLYEMATGRAPFAGATSAVIAAAILHERPVSPRQIRPELPERLDDIILKAIEKDRSLRCQHASEICTDLQRLKRDSNSAHQPAAKSDVHSTIATRWKMIGVAAAVIVTLAGSLTYVLIHRTPVLTDQDTIVLADFTNKTGDPVWDDTLRQGLSVELRQSPFLSVLPEQRVQTTLALMGQPKDARLTGDLAHELCERTGSAAFLEGSIASVGSQYVVGLRATSCNTGSVLDQEQAQAARREDVLNALSEIAQKFRTRVGESLATVNEHSTPLREATTASLEALKAYSSAMKIDLGGGGSSVAVLRRATEIDPEFALAWANLGLAYTGLGEWKLASEATTKAWQLRDRVSGREKFFITFLYDRQVTGDLEKAVQTLELWAQSYPRAAEPPDPVELLAGISTRGTGRFETAIEHATKAIEIYPDVMIGYGALTQSSLVLGRLDDAEKALQLAAARKLENVNFPLFRYTLAFLKGDNDRLDQIVALARGKRVTERSLANLEALRQARSGHLQQARRSSNRAIDLAQQEGAHEAAATYQAARAVWEALCGNAVEAKQDAATALASSDARDVVYAAGLGSGLAGELSRSDALADDLEKRFPEDTFAKFTYVPVLRSISALKRARSTESLEQLQVALRYELAANGLDFNSYLGGLHSAYIRGEAFTLAHQYTEAIAEFHKILDHRGLVAMDPIGALVHLQMGRTFALSGDKPKAKAAYEEFLALWKDADVDTPVLKQARSEYARLE